MTRSRDPRRPLPTLALACLALLVQGWAAGCGSGVPIRYYTLEVPTTPSAPSAAAPAAGDLRVGVEPFAVESPYDQERIAYRPPGTAHEIAFYHYHRWAVPLSRSLQAGMAAALDALDGVSAEPARADVAYDAVLVGRVWRFEEVDESSDAVRVVVELEVGRAGDGERRTFRLGAPVAEPTLEAVVAAFADTLRQAAERIADGLLER